MSFFSFVFSCVSQTKPKNYTKITKLNKYARNTKCHFLALFFVHVPNQTKVTKSTFVSLFLSRNYTTITKLKTYAQHTKCHFLVLFFAHVPNQTKVTKSTFVSLSLSTNYTKKQSSKNMHKTQSVFF